ncbi:TrbC/VirB2 family protein [Pantoea ananatis]|uniref:TrbC/VirB2 family protein n=1 Tax=Pantoea ananas TaxID=553 RepID=UPI001B3186A3|nr:TrbC/VirB2 family protein [Pantoea ananatis]
MKLIKHKQTKHIKSTLAALSAAFISSPALADAFSKGHTIMDNISTGLYGFCAVTITIAVMWVGYQVLFNDKSIGQCKGIIIGGILLASASGIGAFFAS